MNIAGLRVQVSPHAPDGAGFQMGDTLYVSQKVYDAMTAAKPDPKPIDRELAALLAAVAADPTDDVRRLALADWYGEHDQREREGEQRLAVALRRVLAARDDDAPRLEYATACEQFGNPTRAEFIRVQCRLENLYVEAADHEVSHSIRDVEANRRDIEYDEEIDALRAREKELMTRDSIAWLGELPPLRAGAIMRGPSDRDLKVDYLVWCEGTGLSHRTVIAPSFRRGFVESLACPAADWFAHGDAILAKHPIADVTLTTEPEYTAIAVRRDLCTIYGVAGREVVTEPAPKSESILAARWKGVTFAIRTALRFPPGALLTLPEGWTATAAPAGL